MTLKRVIDTCSAGDNARKFLLTEDEKGRYGIFERAARNKLVPRSTGMSRPMAMGEWAKRLFDAFAPTDPIPSHRLVLVQRKLSQLHA